jgi:hypothetical protein
MVVRPGALSRQPKLARDGLSSLSSLVARPGQQLSVFMLSHFLTAFLDDAAQKITSLLFKTKILKRVI